MDRHPKRPRIGRGPIEDEEGCDGDEDELNLAPEKVNALRDPGYQLQKSRAFAAFKLKSAFERIFEKYEKDFTGIGDEIDMTTGEIVVNNGHIQSLKDANLNAPDDGEDVASDTESVQEEERILQGKSSQNLSRAGANPGSSMSLLTGPSVPNGQWSAPDPFMGAPFIGGNPFMESPSRLSSMAYPAQMQFPTLTMPFGVLNPMDNCVESAWRAPELPRPVFRNSMESTLTRFGPRKIPLLTNHNGDGHDNDDDDVLLGVSTTETEGAKAIEVIRIAKLSSPRSLLGKSADGKGGRQTVTPQTNKSRRDSNLIKFQKSKGKGSPSVKHATEDTHSRKTAAKSKLNPKARTEDIVPEAISTNQSGTVIGAAHGGSGTGSIRETPIHGGVAKSKPKRKPKRKQVVAVRVKPPKKLPSAPRIHHTPTQTKNQPDVYVNRSSSRRVKFAIKPTNQTLHVEISVRMAVDNVLFETITPEPSCEPDSLLALVADEDRSSLEECPEASKSGGDQNDLDNIPGSPKAVDADQAEPRAEGFPEARKARFNPYDLDNIPSSPEPDPQPAEEPSEVFSRNVLDPTYAFSDEDEPAIPRRREERRTVDLRASERSAANREDTDETQTTNAAVTTPPEPANNFHMDYVITPAEKPAELGAELAVLDEAMSMTANGLSTIAEGVTEMQGTPGPLETSNLVTSEVEDASVERVSWLSEKSLLRKKRKLPAEPREIPLLQLAAKRPSKKLRQSLPSDLLSQTALPESDRETLFREGRELKAVANEEQPEDIDLTYNENDTANGGSPTLSVSLSEVDRADRGSPTLSVSADDARIADSLPSVGVSIGQTIDRVDSGYITIEDEEEPLDEEEPTLPHRADHEDTGLGFTIAPLPEMSYLSEGQEPTDEQKGREASPSLSVIVERRPPVTPTKKKKRPSSHQVSTYHDHPENPPSSVSCPRSGGVLSLVSEDEDEDELSLTPKPRYYTPVVGSSSNRHNRTRFSLADPGLGSSPKKSTKSTLRKQSAVLLLHGSSRRVVNNNITTPSKSRQQADSTPGRQHHPHSSNRRASLSSALATVHSSGGASSVTRRGSMLQRPGRAISPEFVEDNELVRTPRGTLRRCGEDGFRCDRDFCFVCL
ncbi:hypothetical protein B0T17DRAFT_210372 [Bombardia bombarda]|uniref:Uncharacterized protein n=1 Tax=Bombardia bombarda TaxID=252184 RepID=A0AA40CA45_9PEZI|nr:hypothetical protein B0T17DRAFT_210372 [Bombardia bombarda]